MSKNAIDHVVGVDDDGTGTTGTVVNNALLDSIQDAVDDAIGQVIQTKSGNYTVLSTDDAIICTAALTLTLYTAVGFSARRLDVINTSTGDVTLDGNASETINGATTYTVKAGARVSIRSNGANWFTCTDTPVGLHDVWIPASAMRPLASAPCGWHESIGTTRTIAAMPFDQTTIEYAGFSILMPRSWNEGTLTVRPVWLNTAGGAGNVVWAAYAAAMSDGDTHEWTAGMLQSVTDAAQAAHAIAIASATAALTVSGSPAAGDLVEFLILRNASDGADTYGSDAYLAGVLLSFSTDAPVDA